MQTQEKYDGVRLLVLMISRPNLSKNVKSGRTSTELEPDVEDVLILSKNGAKLPLTTATVQNFKIINHIVWECPHKAYFGDLEHFLARALFSRKVFLLLNDHKL